MPTVSTVADRGLHMDEGNRRLAEITHVTGSRLTYYGQVPALVGDFAVCQRHGIVHIATGSDCFFIDGRAVAIQGSVLSCGAVILEGSIPINVKS